jgi:hypothetical protein
MIRPPTVFLAIIIFSLNVIVGMLEFVFFSVPTLRSMHGGQLTPTDIAIFVGPTLLVCFLIWMISRGQNGARILFAAWFVIGLPGMVMVMSHIHSPLRITIMVLQKLASAFALFLIFAEPGASWFRRRPIATSSSRYL